MVPVAEVAAPQRGETRKKVIALTLAAQVKRRVRKGACGGKGDDDPTPKNTSGGDMEIEGVPIMWERNTPGLQKPVAKRKIDVYAAIGHQIARGCGRR